MRRYFSVMVLLLMPLFLAEALHAQESMQKDRSERKGFILGAGFGGGGAASRGNGGGAYWVNYKIGGGITERVLLFLEPIGLIGIGSSVPRVFGSYVSGQIFFSDHFYVRPKIGFFLLVDDISVAVVRTVLGTDSGKSFGFGFGAGVASGYEWRLTKRFALSPEVNIDYSYLRKSNHFFFGGTLDLRWYF